MGSVDEPRLRSLVTGEAFERDIKRLRKRGKSMEPLRNVIEALRQRRPLDQRHSDHALTGEWLGFRDCHVAFDWVLIYRVDEEAIYLTRTGTHSDLFG